MKKLNDGEYFGSHKQKTQYNDFIITDTEYTHKKVDWHYHENPYFTYLLEGKLYEENKKESQYLTPGSLLFHNWQDAHYNIKPPEYTRGFHIELNKKWFDKYDISPLHFEGSINLQSPLIKEIMNKIFFETKINDPDSQLSIDVLLLDVFNKISQVENTKKSKNPTWVKKLTEILKKEPELCSSLSYISEILNIHPVHLSREFPKYFHTTLADYIRKTKVNTAILLMADKNLSMTEIGYASGFYDQSHFIASFKRIYNCTPSKFKKQISNVNFIQF